MKIPKGVPADTDAYYEAVASQEEIYLEEVEETLRAILISEDPLASTQEVIIGSDCCVVADRLDVELDHTAEELVAGDADGPLLSEEAVAETLSRRPSE